LRANGALTDQGFKVEKGTVYACNGVGFKNILQAGARWLEAHLDQVNRSNVFPVPDGDTGVNMLLTMRAALKAVEQTGDHHVGAIAAAAAQGALMGARGNSGVILSQFLAGLAAGLEDKTLFTAQEWTRAIQTAAERAYQSVVEPVEGTILTIARTAAEAAGRNIQTNQDLVALFAEMVAAARIAQANTPELLPVLKRAGVTDSGGLGLLYILEGSLRWLRNQPLKPEMIAEQGDWNAAPRSIGLEPISLIDEVQFTSTASSSPCGRVEPATSPGQDAGKDQLSLTAGPVAWPNYGYDLQFLIYGHQLDLARLRAYLETIGQSVLVVGEQGLARVHAHVADPIPPLTHSAGLGLVTDVLVEDMSAQVRAFAGWETTWPSLPFDSLEQPSLSSVATMAVAPGPGFVTIWQGLGVDQVILRDPRRPLDIQSLRCIVSRVEAEQLLVVPDSPETAALFRQLQPPAGKKLIAVAPTQTTPQAIAAMLAFNRRLDLETNLARMSQAGQRVQTIELVQRPQHTGFKGSAVGDDAVVALYNGELVRHNLDAPQLVLELLTRPEFDDAEVVTIYFGQARVREQAETLGLKIQENYPELDIELYDGGQPHCDYIISVE
jgi:hypothetical protein